MHLILMFLAIRARLFKRETVKISPEDIKVMVSLAGSAKSVVSILKVFFKYGEDFHDVNELLTAISRTVLRKRMNLSVDLMSQRSSLYDYFMIDCSMLLKQNSMSMEKIQPTRDELNTFLDGHTEGPLNASAVIAELNEMDESSMAFHHMDE